MVFSMTSIKSYIRLTYSMKFFKKDLSLKKQSFVYKSACGEYIKLSTLDLHEKDFVSLFSYKINCLMCFFLIVIEFRFELNPG
jgi:hypothetical protein